MLITPFSLGKFYKITKLVIETNALKIQHTVKAIVMFIISWLQNKILK